MADDRRVYSDEEFALILRKAAELASRVESPAASSAGLTLTEMKSAAAQAGLDPALIERAARMIATTAAASPIERLTGGPVRHNREARFPVTLDEKSAALLLSAVRITGGLAGRQDVGHSSSLGRPGTMAAIRNRSVSRRDRSPMARPFRSLSIVVAPSLWSRPRRVSRCFSQCSLLVPRCTLSRPRSGSREASLESVAPWRSRAPTGHRRRGKCKSASASSWTRLA